MSGVSNEERKNDCEEKEKNSKQRAKREYLKYISFDVRL